MSSVESSLVSSLVTHRKLQDDEDSEPDRANTDDEAGPMSKADRESLTGYQQQFEVFLTLEPPLADDGFKKYFQEMLTNLGSLAQDLRLKKKSLSRPEPTRRKTPSTKAWWSWRKRSRSIAISSNASCCSIQSGLG